MAFSYPMLPSLKDGVVPVAKVGGKAMSLMKLYSTPAIREHVPGGFALSVDFFNPWVDGVLATPEWARAEPKLTSDGAPSVCAELKELAKKLPMSPEQTQVLETLRAEVESWPGGLAAVRSSAPEEDGTGASFAGVFETKLGVTSKTLEDAVRECFASVFDHRVFSYAGVHKPAFAAVVMEMVDSHIAGVAFSANPLNSDLDEMLVDSSWGLGESVVDGSVMADRFVWDKIKKQVIEEVVGSKVQERRLMNDGGVQIRPVDEKRQAQCTLSTEQVNKLGELVCAVEETYGIPMDTEWAFTEKGDLRLLQARPITTLYPMEKKMMTKPGERRVLYFDPNIVSEATTTSPFTHMDLLTYSDMISVFAGAKGLTVPTDPNFVYFNGETRQFINMSHIFKFVGPKTLGNNATFYDPYFASILMSDDCDCNKYKTSKLRSTGIHIVNAAWIFRKFSLWNMWTMTSKFNKAPVEMEAEYKEVLKSCQEEMKKTCARGAEQGLQRFYEDLFQAMMPSINYELSACNVFGPIFKALDTQRREGKTDQERQDAEALLGGFVGDELMETNCAMYNLAQKLPLEICTEYKNKDSELADRIALNVSGETSDLPKDFIEGWQSFMARFGYDGPDQMFVSSPRYRDRPEFLVGKLMLNVGDAIKDPNVIGKEKYEQRKVVMKRLEEEEAAARGWFGPKTEMKKRNEHLDHVMWMRNAPKLHIAELLEALHAQCLLIEDQLLKAGRLAEKGDIFHLALEEVDQAVKDPDLDVQALLAPRKAQYMRAKNSKMCPLLVDSRCRILKPNIQKGEPGTLIGSAIAPGVATGRVRLITSPTEKLEPGEVLATVVTDPAWTPLFVGASAVVLQIGGALQHGALCAREYGKPAVSGIDVTANLSTGMLVTVDGNTGIVKIHQDDPEGSLLRRHSRHLSADNLNPSKQSE